MAKARFRTFPKGSGPLVQDAVGGHVDMAVSSVAGGAACQGGKPARSR